MDTLLPEIRDRVAFTTARVIKPDTGTEWLWVNPNSEHRFNNPKEAETLAELANKNGAENGLDIVNYPYFVVKVSQATTIQRY